MIIIGFGYKKRVGKDTALNFALSFARQYYPSIHIGEISFGNQLKRVSHTMFKWAGLEDAMYYANHPELIEVPLPRIGLSPRQIWDSVGLMGRDIYPKVWVEMAALDIDEEAEVLFSKDIRFPTEIEIIDRFHGYKYRIDRKDAPKGGKVDEALDTYTGWDGIIDNNGTLKEFNTAIKKVVIKHLNPLVSVDKLVCSNCCSRGRATASAELGRFYCSHCLENYSAPTN